MACVTMLLLLIAVAHIIELILVVSSSLNSLVHRCTLQSLLWHRVMSTKPLGDWILVHLMLWKLAAANHVSTTRSLLSDLIILVGITIVEART